MNNNTRSLTKKTPPNKDKGRDFGMVIFDEMRHENFPTFQTTSKFKMFFIKIFGKKIDMWSGEITTTLYKFNGEIYINETT